MARLSARAAGAGRASIAALRGVADALLATYAQLLFSRSRVVGAAMLAATATDPRALLFGLLAVASAALATRLLGFGADVAATGPYGYNALLVGLGLAHRYAFSGTAIVLTASAALVAVLITAALVAVAARVGAPPVLSVPFVLTFWLLLGVAPAFVPAALVPLAPHAPIDFAPATLASAPFPGLVTATLEALGGLLFLPHASAGAVVLGALLWHSRIATSLALAATGLVYWLGYASPVIAQTEVFQALTLNAALSAIALGGVWFVPSAPSFVMALVGALGAVGISLGTRAYFTRLGLPALILPFHASVLLVLFAMRQRAFDRLPKSVDFVPGTPEENLSYFQSRLARFQALYTVGFHLPFRGAWTCTQGVDGALTHQGAWRHGFDFEVRGLEGSLFRSDGASVEDHHCHRLPVLASADGVVVRVERDVPDNAIGAVDLKRNWGNVVVLCHAPGLYSLVAHLAQGSARVYEGQSVRRGDVLGLCGSSGRSPRPHLHFQLQATPQLGAPTLPCRFSDVVAVEGAGEAGLSGTREALQLATTPREGDTLRNVAADEELASFFRFEPGACMAFEASGGAAAAGGRARVEHLEHEIDLLGNLVLRSSEHGATLQFTRADDGFTAFDPLGAPSSVVHLLRAALPRVPFDDAADLVWSDYLPARGTGFSLLGPLRDLVAPLLPVAGHTLDYRAERRGDRLVVRGTSRKTRAGEPLVRTEATLTRARGIVALEVVAGGVRHAATRLDDGARGASGAHAHAHVRDHDHDHAVKQGNDILATRAQADSLFATLRGLVATTFAKLAPSRSGELP
jgi:urea transporter